VAYFLLYKVLALVYKAIKGLYLGFLSLVVGCGFFMCWGLGVRYVSIVLSVVLILRLVLILGSVFVFVHWVNTFVGYVCFVSVFFIFMRCLLLFNFDYGLYVFVIFSVWFVSWFFVLDDSWLSCRCGDVYIGVD